MSLSAGTRLGPYEILSPLGAGGMGEVYRARDTRLGRDVAVKVLPAKFSQDADRLRRFEGEARAASALNHPNILTIHDFGMQESAPYVVSELLEGETLRERLAGEALPARRAVDYARQVAQGLAAAHEKGIVHRDLKPENLFVTRDGRVKILDFGLAKLTHAEPPAGGQTSAPTVAPDTEPGVVLGTIGYMSPEQVRGQAADVRSDIFTLGAILYEMLTGRRAFRGNSAVEAMNAILKEEPPEASKAGVEIPAPLERITRRCLEKSPEERFQSARDLAFALQEAATVSMPLAVSVSPPVPGRHPLLTRTRVAIGIALLLVIAAAGVTILRKRIFGGVGPRRIQSLAVLPLDNLSRDPEQQFFADGMTEALITDLAQIRSLRVISRTSVMGFRATKKPLPQIGRELNVDAVLEGSVVKSGGRVRITAQLVEAPTDRHVWAKSYERDLRDVLALQSEVARAVAGEIRATLTPDEESRLARARPVDPQVHELVLRGRYTLSNAASEQDLRKAVSLFEQALAKDPANAAAYAGLAYCHIGFTDFYLPPWETMPRAKAAALRALEIDETLADAHTALGGVSFAYDWNWTAAERELRRAIELNPNSAEARDYYALYLSDLGRSEEALAEIRKARELDPLSVMIHVDAINEFFSLHRYDEAVERGRMALELDPGNGNARVMLAIVLVQQGRLREAVAEAEKAIQSGDSPLVLATAGGVFPAAGDPGRARRILGELAEVSKKRYVCPYEIGVIHLALGEKDEAFRWLEKGFRDRSICMQGTRQDPRLEPLHGDPRYEDLLRRLAYPTNPQMPPPARTPR
jgi:TolB-like protein/thioredoxin-like negative regulator of GroEL